jgi:hypothetical protein
MKSTFVFGFLLGLAGVLVGAYFAPWANYERVASKTIVAMNGGREESFVIRLPDDRIVAAGLGAGAAMVDPVMGVAAPSELAGGDLLAEHFKLRDVDGTVIGVAGRHWTAVDAGAASIWALSIPARGEVVLAASDLGAEGVWQALTSAGYRAGTAWTGEVVVQLPSGGPLPHVVTGTEEFADTEGRFDETWTVTGVSDAGELRGTVVIRTTVNSKS